MNPPSERANEANTGKSRSHRGGGLSAKDFCGDGRFLRGQVAFSGDTPSGESQHVFFYH